jgi:AbrB family looped-hinge helix DNA binding protein
MQIVIYQIFPTALRLTNWKTGCKLYKYEIYPLKEGGGVAGGKHILGKAKRHIFGTAKVGEKGQIVIPKDARQIFGVKPGDTLLILGDEETGIIVTKPDVLRDAADEIFGKMER